MNTDRLHRYILFPLVWIIRESDPEHANLYDTKRANYVSVTDDEAVDAFEYLSRIEESSRPLKVLMRWLMRKNWHQPWKKIKLS